jgi:hypothetical protein
MILYANSLSARCLVKNLDRTRFAAQSIEDSSIRFELSGVWFAICAKLAASQRELAQSHRGTTRHLRFLTTSEEARQDNQQTSTTGHRIGVMLHDLSSDPTGITSTPETSIEEEFNERKKISSNST